MQSKARCGSDCTPRLYPFLLSAHSARFIDDLSRNRNKENRPRIIAVGLQKAEHQVTTGAITLVKILIKKTESKH